MSETKEMNLEKMENTAGGRSIYREIEKTLREEDKKKADKKSATRKTVSVP